MELSSSNFMIPFSFKLRLPLLFRASATSTATFNLFSTTSLTLTTSTAAAAASQSPPCDNHSILTIPEPPIPETKRRTKVSKVVSNAQLKENWLDSLSCPLPFPLKGDIDGDISSSDTNAIDNAGSEWVIGVDPDVSGALALLKPDQSAQVYDSPYLSVLVGKRIRKRLDAKSIVQLLHSFGAPKGTTAYLEQSIPFPRDGKQGWWSGGFGYGLWIGILVASGFSVVPVPSFVWKNEFKLSGKSKDKDDSREVASTMFPSMSSLLKRKKDHGRAEALLIAAYGKSMRMKPNSSCFADD